VFHPYCRNLPQKNLAKKGIEKYKRDLLVPIIMEAENGAKWKMSLGFQVAMFIHFCIP